MESLTWAQTLPILKNFARQSESARGERFASSRIKQWLKSLAQTFPEARELFEEVKRIETLSVAALEAAIRKPAVAEAEMVC